MNRAALESLVLLFGIFSMLGLSIASDYAFGTKVAPQDYDLGRPLKNIPNGTVIGVWDIGVNLGTYDAGDVVYLDTPPIGIVNANDIRLTPFGNHQAGTKVTPHDDDMNAPLKTMSAEIRFLNLNGSQSYDLNDPIYIHQPTVLDLSGIEGKDANEPITNQGAAGPTIAYSNTAENIVNTNSTNEKSCSDSKPFDAKIDYSPHPTDNAANQTKEVAATQNQDNPIASEGFWERLPYTGNCDNLPKGTTCLIYSDIFVWPVSDHQIDTAPSVVGFDNIGRPIEAIRCNNADYYHILGTIYVKSVLRQKDLFIQSASEQDAPDLGSYPGNSGIAGDVNRGNARKLINALSSLDANSDSIKTNDVRLTSVGKLGAGTKVLNFDIDLNKVVALPVLVSFPRKSDDYACIRVYDANGNGLYDFPDDVYLDISFPGYSPFGTVSINDVRLTGSASR
jgi:hypothetical protein